MIDSCSNIWDREFLIIENLENVYKIPFGILSKWRVDGDFIKSAKNNINVYTEFNIIKK